MQTGVTGYTPGSGTPAPWSGYVCPRTRRPTYTARSWRSPQQSEIVQDLVATISSVSGLQVQPPTP
ncbi:MAG: hypothetical protein P1S60_17485 [Anaerolineae bacterium]|nr:hypothetical protein [Anaerolineae bacterium]